MTIVNAGGNKLDYYLDYYLDYHLDWSMTWQRTGCGPIRRTTVTITLTNAAPAPDPPAACHAERRRL